MKNQPMMEMHTLKNYLGFCYEHGKGVNQDYQKAVEWYIKSCQTKEKNSF